MSDHYKAAEERRNTKYKRGARETDSDDLVIAYMQGASREKERITKKLILLELAMSALLNAPKGVVPGIASQFYDSKSGKFKIE